MELHGTNVSAAAHALGIPDATLRNRHRRAIAAGYRPNVQRPPVIDGPIREPLTSFEEAWAQWQKAIGMAKDRYVQPTKKVGTRRKILVMPDLHAPFHEAEMFAAMLEREADADHVIGIGDIGDSYSLSRFEKYERMPYRDEWAAVNLVVQELATRFPTVELVLGNHDVRLERQLRQRVTEDMVDAISFMTGGVLCPITAMAKRYPNVSIANHETPSGRTVDWFTTCGDAWLGHPEKYSRVPGSALRATEEWIADNEHALGLDQFRLICIGHTHQAGIIPWRADKLLCEVGCLCKTQGYMLSARIGGRPQRRGYVTFIQNDGATDLNSVKFTWLDVAV